MAELEAASLPAVTLGKTFGMPNRDAGNCFIFKSEGGIVKGAALCQLRQRIKGSLVSSSRVSLKRLKPMHVNCAFIGY